MKLFTQNSKGKRMASLPVMPQNLLWMIALLVMAILPFQGSAQNVDLQSSVACITSAGGTATVTFNNAPPASTGGTVRVYYTGDVSYPNEIFEIFDEGSTKLGETGNGTGQCSGTYDSVDFTINAATLSSWTSDGTVTFTADASSGVSSTLCTNPCSGVKIRLFYTSTSGGNNAGVLSIDEPGIFCSGTQTVKATIGNMGINQISTVTVNWSVGGVTQTPVTHTSTLDTIKGTGPSTAQITLGTYNFAGQAQEVKIWTSNPNNANDTINNNDTLTTTIGPALTGTYTIGGTNPDYANFTDAVNALVNSGVCGPVTFNVRAGTYNERVALPEITGASATNTIKFVGAGKSTTTIRYNASSTTSDMQTILLDGADYITFENFTVEGNDGSYAVGIHFTNNANYNAFNNIDIEVSTTGTSNELIGILGSGSASDAGASGESGNYNTFMNINITGGYYGIKVYGSSNTDPIDGNEFINDTINEYYYYGMYFYYNNEILIKDNYINTTRSNSNADGLYLYYAIGYEVTGNYINAPDYGMYVYYSNYYAYYNKRGRIINNMITSGDYPFRLYRSENTDVYHNSIFTNNGPYGMYIYYSDGADVQNNIVKTTGSSDEAVYISNTSFITLDYNIYHAANADLVYDNGTYYATLADWQAATPQFNEHSYQQDPGFISNSNLHLNNTGAKPYGAELGIQLDIDGDVRCDFAPTIGADESLIGKTTMAIAEVFAPDSVFTNSPVLFEGRYVQGSLQRNRWYIDDVLMKDSIDFNTVFTAPGQYEVKVVSRSCSNVDADSITITVYDPTTAPVADFIASANEIGEGEVVSLTNLSEHGPTSFLWQISPDVTYINNNPVPTYKFVGGSSTTAFPDVQFLYSGVYEVCLVATNSLGSDTACRTAYIEVLPKVNLGSQTVIRASKGYLYDDGGPDNNYSDGGSGTKITGVLIDACASEVFLKFNELNLECGYDYVRVYDGSSNQGTPLFSCTNNIGPDGGGPGFTGPGCNEACDPVGDTLVATSGTMYIEMESDPAVTAPGFEAFWWTTPANVAEPVAMIDGPDSVCRNNIVTFMNTSTGNFNTYKWDFDGDFSVFESEDSVSAEWGFVLTGTTTITLIAENCGGIDTLQKTITVYNPDTPAVTFTANNLRPTPTDIVTFMPTLSECVDKYKWTFTYANGTSSYTFENGTNASSVMPMVTFSDTGCWDVMLWAENVTGDDSLIKNCYIRVKENYCTPTVGTVVSDIGIANVKFNTINNTSAQGASSYTNFVNTESTTVEIGVTYDLEVSRNSSVNNITYAAWIDWNQDGDFDDVNEEVGRLVNTSSTNWTQSITVPIIVKEGPTVMRVGVSRGSGANTPCGQNSFGEFEDYRVIISQDQTPPVITLIGSADTMVEQGRTYVDPGFTAFDNLKGNVTQDVTTETFLLGTETAAVLNTFVVRDYEIRYTVKDDADNVGTATRIVRVFPDTTAPVLNIGPDLQLSVDAAPGTYVRPAVISAVDNISGNFTANVQVVTSIDNTMYDTVQIMDPVDPAVVDTYTVTYYAVDPNGNETTVTRTVVIFDDVAPTITLNGDNPVEHQIGEPYTDAGADPDDNYYSDAELTPLMTASTNLDINKFGTYSYTYTLTDPSGNGPVTATRTIIITDTIEPMIMLIGRDSIVADVNEPFIDQGVQVNDNYGLKGTWTAGGSFYDNFPDGVPTYVGVYTIVYSVEDLAGNVVTVDRIINVVDRVAPEVELIGGSAVNICRWVAYEDSGYVATDNYDEAGELTVEEEGSWYTDYLLTGLPGTYSIRYKVTDSSDNVTYSTVRTINVLHESDFRCKGNSIADSKQLENSITLYPNPNSGMFTVKANLPEMKQVRMSILNTMGQEVAVVTEGMLQTGVYSVDLSTQASGVYFLQVTTENHSFTKQVVIAR